MNISFVDNVYTSIVAHIANGISVTIAIQMLTMATQMTGEIFVND